jgi:hypothetical protein
MNTRIPRPLRRAARAVLGSYTEPVYYGVMYWWARMTDPRMWESVRRLQAMRDSAQAERCFVIGNGPSLNRMDLSPLRDEVTFGQNRIYMMFEKLGFTTSYLVSVNKLFLEQVGDEIAALPCPKFISYRARDDIRFTDDMAFVFPHFGPRFSIDASLGMWEGSTVTNMTLQLAYHFGFRTVILIGVDHYFATPGDPHKLVVSEGGDPNHFDPNYFDKGFQWHLPDLRTSEVGYLLAKDAFERDGRRVLDATVDGTLQVFEKIDYETLF